MDLAQGDEAGPPARCASPVGPDAAKLTVGMTSEMPGCLHWTKVSSILRHRWRCSRRSPGPILRTNSKRRALSVRRQGRGDHAPAAVMAFGTLRRLAAPKHPVPRSAADIRAPSARSRGRCPGAIHRDFRRSICRRQFSSASANCSWMDLCMPRNLTPVSLRRPVAVPDRPRSR